MFRFLFRSRIAPCLQPPARPQARRSQPHLEALEDRITPSPLVPPANGNPNAVSDTGNSPAVCQEKQVHSSSADGQPDQVPPPPDGDNDDSANTYKDLVFQGLHGGENNPSTTACTDLVLQGLQDSGYLVWVAANHDPVPQTSDSPDAFLAFGDFLHALDMGMTGSAESTD
ncbi:MAG TPA: hypothetical protein VH682_30195 [Gemmataceae bacterium]